MQKMNQNEKIKQKLVFILIDYIHYHLNMKSQFQSRPQSKGMQSRKPMSKEINKETSEQYFKRGKIEQQNKCYAKAAQLYMRSIMYNPFYYQAFCNLGYCYRAMGRFTQAKVQYLKSIAIKEDDAISHYNLANLYRIMGENQQSIEQYKFVMRLKDQRRISVGHLYFNSLVNLGICYKNIKMYEEAIKQYEKANLIEPYDEGALFNHAMCIIELLDKNRVQAIQELTKERIAKATSLLSKTLKINSDNFMAQFCLIKLSYLTDRSQHTLLKAIDNYKTLLSSPNHQLHDQINQQTGYCLSKLKKYQESARYYKSSVENIPKEPSKNYNGIEFFSKFAEENQEFYSQADLINLIEKGQVAACEQIINKLEQGVFKNTIQLIICLKQGQVNENYLERAYELYGKCFFDESGKHKIDFKKISIEGHKAIAKLLVIYEQFEQSIKHYEYIRSQIQKTTTDNNTTMRLRSSIGQGFQAMGLQQKALEEYKIALAFQPENYSLVYNVGCSLYENGQISEAMIHFQKFLALIDFDQNLDKITKNLYIADCLINMALCNKNQKNQLEAYEKAFQKLLELDEEGTGQLQLEESILIMFFSRLAQLLEIEIMKSRDIFLGNKLRQRLLQVYSSMLQFESCPDRDQIYNNCGVIYYDQFLYVNALNSFLEVTSPENISHLYIALCYLHLFQHSLAIKYIYLAYSKNEKDGIVRFNFQVFNWIYGITKDSQLDRCYPCLGEQLLFYRLQYGICLIDKVSIQLNKLSIDLSNKQVASMVSGLINNDKDIQFQKEQTKIKFKAILAHLKNSCSSGRVVNDHLVVKDQILKICFKKSKNIQADFLKLLSLLKKIDRQRRQITILQTCIHLFIYFNQYDSQIIKDTIQGQVLYKQQTHILTLDNLCQPEEDMVSIEYTNQQIKELVLSFREWECLLENKLRLLIAGIEKAYYMGNYKSPLQVQYHFPRNSNLKECHHNFNKVAFIVINLLKHQANISFKGKNLKEMKSNYIKEFEYEFNHWQKKEKTHLIQQISLSQKFLPVTLHAFFTTREDCLKFIANLMTLSSQSKKIEISKECQRVIMIINNLVSIKCQWGTSSQIEDAISSIMENILENPLYIVNQSILSLESLIDIIKEEKLFNLAYFEKEEVFKS